MIFEKIGVGYVRYSSDNQREESIDAQKRKIEEYCVANNIKLLRYYEDRAKSATSTINRKDFNEMIQDSAEKIFQYVVVHKLDRFARNRHDSIVNKCKLKANGVSVLSVVENMDGSPESVMMESVIEGMSEFYSLNLSREVRKGLSENSIKGFHNGGIAPLGFNVNKETRLLEVNQHEAGAVKIIFEMFDKGYGYKKIIEDLKSKGFKTKIGNDFKKNSLHDLLKNEKYRGCYQYNLKSSKNPFGKRNNHSYKTDGVTRIENGCPRIVEDELFQRVQDRMAINRTSTGKYKAKENYILSGKIICGACGSKLSGSRRHSGRNKKLYVTYKCSGKDKGCDCITKEINKVYIENFVLSQIKSLLFNKNHIDKLVDEVNKYATANNSSFALKIQGCVNQINGINRKAQNILTAIEDGVPKASYGNRIEELEASKALLQEEIKALEIQKDIPAISKNQIEKLLKKFRGSALKESTLEAKKLVSEYVERVVVYNDNIEVFLKVDRKISDKYKEVC